jgi:rubredoxin
MRRWKCKVCGYVHEAEVAPRICPVCGAVYEGLFIEIDDIGREVAVQPQGDGIKG